MLGDQVYADQVSPETERLIEERRGSGEASAEDPPRGEVADFEEYTWLYREAWSDPATRWLLSTIPSAMIFDAQPTTSPPSLTTVVCSSTMAASSWPKR